MARQILRFTVGNEAPGDIRLERSWRRDGVEGEEVSWWVGYGPRTRAWVLKPTGTHAPLPGIVALYDHGHYKFLGKEKIADGPEGPLGTLTGWRNTYYGGRAFANVLAREGFVVLVPDVFLWGSRRFPIDTIPAADRMLAAPAAAMLGFDSIDPEIARYNGASYLHEHLVSKYCSVLGTSLAAIVAYEDRVALNYLATRSDVDAKHIGCIGFSGGGLRAGLLSATSDRIAATAIAGMMSTYAELLGTGLAAHTWLLYPNGWSQHGDWPDLVASAAPNPLLVQYSLADTLFSEKGMRAADARIKEHYVRAGANEAYRAEFDPGPHRFDEPMQRAASSWLQKQLLRRA